MLFQDNALEEEINHYFYFQVRKKLNQSGSKYTQNMYPNLYFYHKKYFFWVEITDVNLLLFQKDF